MWGEDGPKLKFARARIKVEEAAALLIANWGGDRWGYTVRCSPFDYFGGERRLGPVTPYMLFPPVSDMWAPPESALSQGDTAIGYERFELRPCLDVPEGEAWLSFPAAGSL